MDTRTSIVLRISLPESTGKISTGRPAVNVTLYPTGLQQQQEGGDEDGASPSGGGGASVGHPVGGGIFVDPRCKPNSPLAVMSSSAGMYMDAASGAATGIVQVEAGEYLAIVCTFSPQEADFLLTVFSLPALLDVRRLV